MRIRIEIDDEGTQPGVVTGEGSRLETAQAGDGPETLDAGPAPETFSGALPVSPSTSPASSQSGMATDAGVAPHSVQVTGSGLPAEEEPQAIDAGPAPQMPGSSDVTILADPAADGGAGPDSRS